MSSHSRSGMVRDRERERARERQLCVSFSFSRWISLHAVDWPAAPRSPLHSPQTGQCTGPATSPALVFFLTWAEETATRPQKHRISKTLKLQMWQNKLGYDKVRTIKNNHGDIVVLSINLQRAHASHSVSWKRVFALVGQSSPFCLPEQREDRQQRPRLIPLEN